MQKIRKEIYSLRKYRIKYNEQHFLTLTFDKLDKTAGNLLGDVKRQHSEWVKKPSYFNTGTFIADMINFYMDYKSTGEWDKQSAEHNKIMVALATALKQELAKNRKSPGNPTSSATKTPATDPGNSATLPAWKFKNAGKTTAFPDNKAKYECCKLHIRKNENGYRTACVCLPPQP